MTIKNLPLQASLEPLSIKENDSSLKNVLILYKIKM